MFRYISKEITAKATTKVPIVLYNNTLYFMCRTSSPQPYEEDKIPTPCKPDPLGLESSHPFRGHPSQGWSKPQEEETEEEDDGYYRQMEEEFEADYPSQREEEEEVTDRVEQHEAAGSDSESSSCGEVEEGEERDYPEPQDGSYMAAEASQSLQRGQKRTHEEAEEEEGEVNDDNDIQVCNYSNGFGDIC